MILSHLSFVSPSQGRSRFLGFSFALAAAFVGWQGGLSAAPVPQNLGNGLAKLVESNLAVRAVKPKGYDRAGFVTANGHVYADTQAANYAAIAIADTQERFLVRINPSGKMDLESLRQMLQANFSSVEITAVDSSYHGLGVFNAFVSLDEVPALASLPGVRRGSIPFGATRPNSALHRMRSREMSWPR